MDSISSAATEEKIMTRRGVLKITKSNLLKDKSLWKMFLESTSKINIDGITEENKKIIFQCLVEKSTNAWFEDSFKRLRAKQTVRGTKKQDKHSERVLKDIQKVKGSLNVCRE